MISRRGFLAAGATLVGAAPLRTVRVGLVGVGNRGFSHLLRLLKQDNLAFPAICDINPEKLARAQAAIEKAGLPKPEGYGRGDDDYQRMVAREDLDAVLVVTPWEWHARMAVAALRAGKYTAVEVPIALTVEECWELVDASEKAGAPCMMLENWSFRRDNLAVLNMIRAGLLGEIVHCHSAHSHNCIDWYFEKDGTPRWSGRHLLRRNADQYPTHALGPVLSWMDINCGDRFQSLTSTATRSLGINRQFARRFGADRPAARRRYAQSDIVTTVIKTVRGNTVVVNNDMQLPRPYDNRWMIQGTDGIYDEDRASVYLEGHSPKNEEWEPFAPYQERYDHAWWKAMTDGASAAGHGGVDFIELALFLRAVRERTAPPIDVYDSVIMSVITPLSEQSITRGSAPVEVPDFTRGRWQSAKPTFGIVTA